MDAFFARYFPHDGDAAEGYHEAIRTALPDTRRLLDLGCGDNTDLAVYRGGNREVWGVDFQAHPQLANRAWFRPLEANGRVPFPDGYFDTIASRWVLEHVETPQRFLDEVRRLLRPGGSFIALTVNASHYVSWLSRLTDLLPHTAKQWLVQRLYARPIHDTFPTCYRLNTRAGLRRQALRTGLHLTAVARFANPDYFSFSPLLRRGAVLTDWLLEQAGTDLGRLYMVVTLHKPAAPVTRRNDRRIAA
ncbi:MAG TPA: methyltransferase domain-containing protein [Gemmataceae bacterium]|nr:methyltransferase domain-containing protein [Gemmataceae bacterium]